jgi:hypothetical protein
MDEPFNAGSLCLACELPGCFHMQRLEGLGSAFAIEADGIHHAIGAGDRCINRAFVSNIRTYALVLGMSRCNPGRNPSTGKMAYEVPPQKSCSPKYRHDPIGHRRWNPLEVGSTHPPLARLKGNSRFIVIAQLR